MLMVVARRLVVALALAIGLQAWAADPVLTWSFDPAVYASPGSIVAHCTVQAPLGGDVFSLLWSPNLPEGWTVSATWGDGAPEFDGVSGDIVFLGLPLATNGIVAFSYRVQVPAGDTNAWIVQPDVEAQLTGEDNPWVGSASAVTIEAGGNIAAIVWHDLNGNGVLDAGEPGISNVTVNLLDTSSNVLFTTLTDTNGDYTFANLAPTNYLLQFVAPGGFAFTTMSVGGTNSTTNSAANAITGQTTPFTLLPGQTDTIHNAGLYLPARVFGYAFVDQNTNSFFDANDTSASNLAVRLMLGGTQVAATTSDTGGLYQVTGLIPGAYTVVFGVRTDATVLASVEALPGSPPASTNSNRTRAVVTGTNVTANVTLISGDGVLLGHGEPINIGFKPETQVSAVFVDAFAAATGVVVEVSFATVLEPGTNSIVLYLFQGGNWVEVGRQVAVDGTKRYRFFVPGLNAGDICNLRVSSDTGTYFIDANQTVGLFDVQSIQANVSGFWLQWSALPGRVYDIYQTDQLSGGGTWVLIQTLTNTTMTYSNSTFISYPPGGSNEFYKVIIE